MATDFNTQEAVVNPDSQWSSPADVTQEKMNVLVKSISDQCWSVVQAMKFADAYVNGLRDPDNLAAMVADTLDSAVDQADGSADSLSEEYDASVSRREELGLDPVDEESYNQQRSPSLLPQLVVNMLNASGLESELAEADTETVEPDANLSGISDETVRSEAAAGGTNAQAERAREIAEKLGLNLSESAGEHLVIPDVSEIDSTDPYIKKVMG